VVTAPPDAGGVGCTSTNLNLLTNSDFEAGSNGMWTEVSGGGFTIVTDEASGAAHSGAFVGWLGGYLSGVDELYQDIVIPADATDLAISGQSLVATEETSGAWDIADMQIRNTSGSILETVTSWSNSDADGTNDWHAFSKNLADYSGQTVRVYMRSQTDGSLNTSFLVDTMALTATVCQ
jgi:aminopeptidase S